MKQETNYKRLIETIYKDGIIEDLKNGRHISAIICGYGATFTNDYRTFVNALKSFEWFNNLYSEETNGRI